MFKCGLPLHVLKGLMLIMGIISFNNNNYSINRNSNNRSLPKLSIDSRILRKSKRNLCSKDSLLNNNHNIRLIIRIIPTPKINLSNKNNSIYLMRKRAQKRLKNGTRSR